MDIKIEKLHDVLKYRYDQISGTKLHLALSDGSIKRIIDPEKINELDNIDIVVRGIYQTDYDEITIFYSKV